MICRVFFALAWVVVLHSQALCPPCFGQPQRSIPRGDGRLFSAPRILRAQLREAEAAIDARQYSTAAALLGELLEAGEKRLGGAQDLAIGQDYFLDTELKEGEAQANGESLLRRVRRIIGSLPERGLEAYRLLYEPIATRELDLAESKKDWEGVRRVRRLYGHTEAGHQASLLLAQRAIFHGHPLQASLILDELVASSSAIAGLGPSVAVLHAMACRAGGREVPDLTPTDLGSGDSLRINSRIAKWDEMTSTEDWLKSFYASPVGEVFHSGGDYRWLGDAPSRNGDSAGEMPLRKLWWMVETTAAPRQGHDIWTGTQERRRQGIATLPAAVPLRVGSMVLMRTTDRLFGVDVDTGKRVFPYPITTAPAVVRQPVIDPFTRQPVAVPEDSDALVQRVWTDMPYGMLSSDGERVFLLDDLPPIRTDRRSRFGGRLGGDGVDDGNKLVALELETEGKILWQLGGAEAAQEQATTVFYLGPPLPLDGKLYVLVESSGDIELRCLDPVDGKTLWRQQLVAAAESGGINNDVIRRITGATPTYHEGVLVCPTGTGVTVAVDLCDRALRWAHASGRYMRFSPGAYTSSPSLRRYANRWRTSNAIASGSMVYLTPAESNNLEGLDLVSGQRRFPGIARGEAFYLAGIRRGTAIVVGPSAVRGYDSRTGELRWQSSEDLFGSGQTVCGLGCFGEGFYLLPTTTDELVAVSTLDGTVVARRKVSFQLGNLVYGDRLLFSQGVTELSAAFGEASLRPWVRSRLSQKPDDLFALLRKTELLLQIGDHASAIETVARAERISPENDEVHELSVIAMLGLLRESDSPEAALLANLDRRIDSSVRRAEFMRLQIRNSLRTGNHAAATKQLLELSQLALSRRRDLTVGPDSQNARVSIDAWLTARCAEIATAVDGATRGELQRMIAETLDEQQPTESLRRSISHFRPIGGLQPLKATLLQRLGRGVSPLELERVLLGPAIPTNDALASFGREDLTALAAAYAAGGCDLDAKFATRLAERASGPGVDSAEAARLLSQTRGSWILDSAWPAPLSASWQPTQSVRRFGRQRQPTFVRTHYSDSRQYSTWRVVAGGNRPLAFLDEQGTSLAPGLDVAESSGSLVEEVIISGSVAILVFDTELVAVDLSAVRERDPDAVLWRRNLGGDGSLKTKSHSRLTPFSDPVTTHRLAQERAVRPVPDLFVGPVLGDRMFIRRAGELICLDVLSSEVLWQASSTITNGVVVAEGDRVALVSAETAEVDVYGIHDGEFMDRRQRAEGVLWSSSPTAVLTYQLNADDDQTPPRDKRREYTIRLAAPLSKHPGLETTGYRLSEIRPGDRSTYGNVVDKRWLFLVSRDGDLKIWDLIARRELVSEKIEGLDRLNKMHGMQIGGRLVVLADRITDRPAAGIDQTTPKFDEASNQSHYGARMLLAFDAVDGRKLWQREFDRRWACTAMQPAASPLILLTRGRVQLALLRGQANTRLIDVIGLDVRTGETRFDQADQEIPSGNASATMAMLVPLKSQILVEVENSLLRLSFGGSEAKAAEGEGAESPKVDSTSDDNGASSNGREKQAKRPSTDED